MITMDGKPGELFKANVWLREKLFKAKMERDRMIWDNRNSAWAAMYETQWASQAQVEVQSRLLSKESCTKLHGHGGITENLP